MKTFKQVVGLIPQTKENMLLLTDIIDEHMEELRVAHEDMFWDVMCDLHILAYGEHFDEESAKYAVSMMSNEDGTKGEHWSLAETDGAAISEGITTNLFDWYYVLNMMYSDYYSVTGNNSSMLVKMAKAWIQDKDAPEGKAYLYWKMIKENM